MEELLGVADVLHHLVVFEIHSHYLDLEVLLDMKYLFNLLVKLCAIEVVLVTDQL